MSQDHDLPREDDLRNKGKAPSKQSSIRPILETIQYGSAATFSIFLAAHLASPISAIFGGEAYASQTMLLARDLIYQRTDIPLEPIVVFGSLSVHVVAGAVKRLITPGPRRKVQLHALTGYLLIPVVGLHAWHHRIKSARGPNPLSPSLVSYQLVARALYNRPIYSWLAYGTLVILATYHTLAGIRRMSSDNRRPAKLQTLPWKSGYALLMTSIGLGLARIASEGSEVPLWLATRYDAILS